MLLHGNVSSMMEELFFFYHSLLNSLEQGLKRNGPSVPSTD